MSLDVYLNVDNATKKEVGSGIFVRRDGQTVEITREEWDREYGGEPAVFTTEEEETTEVYHANITHNLGEMAKEAGIYECLWRPEEVGITKASQLIEPLSSGFILLQAFPERFTPLNPENGWGSYEGLVKFVLNYAVACRKYPDADVSVWR